MGFILRTGQMHNVVVLGLFILIDKDKYRPDFSLHGYVNNRGLASPIAGNARQCFYAVAPYGVVFQNQHEQRVHDDGLALGFVPLQALHTLLEQFQIGYGVPVQMVKIVRFDGHPRAMFFMIVATMNCLELENIVGSVSNMFQNRRFDKFQVD